MNKQYYALQYKSDDGIHKKGDIQYVDQDVLHIGQTPECSLTLPSHPDYADTCYAVILKDADQGTWHIIRQEKDAAIYINGTPLELVQNIRNNDRLTFDNTVLVFSIREGETPRVQYIMYKAPRWIKFSFFAVFLLLLGIIFTIHQNSKKTISIFKNEIESIYKIEAKALLVISQQEDTLDILPADRAYVGTGFVTEDGYFVTARHCVEFWLGMENELKPSLHDIESEIVKKAIEAEMDTTIRLVSQLKITSHDGKESFECTSNDFTMDKTRDNIYDCGDFETEYLWRSIVSVFEKRDAELGDVAIMTWGKGESRIVLEEPDVLHDTETELCSFGYPQNEGGQEAVFALDEGKIYQQKESPDECFICTKGFDQGFSGGPVFAKDKKTVIGVVSRSSGKHTLVVPVSQIHRLINKIEKEK